MLGSGGFGVTYLARDEKLDKLFAIKEYFPSDFAYRNGATVRAREPREDDFSWGKARFVEEARILARFAHPNIVDVVQIFDAHNTAYIVEEYLGERSLKKWLDDIDGPPTQEELDLLLEPLLNALEVIHRNDVLHRDIAPDNICIRDDGSPVLFDFGSAREAVAQRTRTVSAVVKPGYSPPELYSTRGKDQGPWSDIYGLAATLYYAVTETKPEEATERVLADDYVSARKTAKGSYRDSFLDAIDRGLQLAPSQRPQSIGEWRSALLGKDVVQKVLEQVEPVRNGDGTATDETPQVNVESRATTRSDGQIPADIAAGAKGRRIQRNSLGYALLAGSFIIIATTIALMQFEESVRRIALPHSNVAGSQNSFDEARQQSLVEEGKYLSARGYVGRLRDYLNTCRYCGHRSDARSEIASLEQTQQMREIPTQTLCQNALDVSKADWDQSASYQEYVAEAKARGLNVDGCRGVLGMLSRTDELKTPNPSTVQFNITNNTTGPVGVAFYDGGGNRFFPPEGRYYSLDGKGVRTYSMECSTGQKVCFGSWKGNGGLNSFWGVGVKGKESCSKCCVTCPTAGAVSYTINDSDARRPNPTLTWTITNNTHQSISIAFYSEKRRGHGWPDWNRNWSLHGGQNSFTLSCRVGEKICFGAWRSGNINGVDWGVGPRHRHGCQRCCAVCNGDSAFATLND